ncbi:methyltransferase family protein [Chitinolyticbacter meiyuanensis]|uniref:methyltransferase family protein n=1 Tax=Chitinolyticbacter meiyuanensis TaxID=682798 RepID=UPI0011E60037|nr:isoprenylcysteine carboxylmethyltransferase family protein [Chitinolyticbacter meiyuanensis]
MLARALFAFLALPGMVAFAVPLFWLARGGHTVLLHPLGLMPLLVGSIGLLWCVRDFYVAGRGTLAPWSPPRQLVVIGLYRYSRNPMYLSVLLIVLGWSALSGVAALALYAAALAVSFQLRVVYGEEPWLARAHGQAWRDYSSRVRRWR